MDWLRSATYDEMVERCEKAVEQAADACGRADVAAAAGGESAAEAPPSLPGGTAPRVCPMRRIHHEPDPPGEPDSQPAAKRAATTGGRWHIRPTAAGAAQPAAPAGDAGATATYPMLPPPSLEERLRVREAALAASSQQRGRGTGVREAHADGTYIMTAGRGGSSAAKLPSPQPAAAGAAEIAAQGWPVGWQDDGDGWMALVVKRSSIITHHRIHFGGEQGASSKGMGREAEGQRLADWLEAGTPSGGVEAGAHQLLITLPRCTSLRS